jgi:hypothetical protein
MHSRSRIDLKNIGGFMEEVFRSPELIALGITGVVGVGIWLLRLEGRLNTQAQRTDIAEKSIERLWERLTTMDSEMMKELRRQGESLARIEGQLRGKFGGET